MPTKRTRRMRHLQVSALTLPLRDLLLQGALRPASEQVQLRDEGVVYSSLEKYTTTDAMLQAHWRTHRDELLTEWTMSHPGTRPEGFWRFDAPEPRRRLGGIGDPYAHGSGLGIPTCWATSALGSKTFAALAPLDPPRFESQAAFLERLGLLSVDERRRVPASAFDPEVILRTDILPNLAGGHDAR